MKENDINQNAPTDEILKNTSKEIAANEISQEKLEERLLLTGLLIQKTDELAKEAQKRKQAREREEIELRSGIKISIQGIRDFIIANARPYSPMFPNTNPFFPEMYRLNGWNDRDPHEWIKPLQVPNWLNEIIYGRFPKDVLPSIQILNPYLPGLCIRGYKNFQFLNEQGLSLVVQFRDEAVNVMQSCSTWHEFRMRFSQAPYNVPYTYQQGLYEAKNNKEIIIIPRVTESAEHIYFA